MGKRFIYKILTAGEGGVGKTSLLKRYVEGTFTSDLKLTVGVEFFVKEVKIGENDYALQLWDFGGQDRFQFMHDSYVIGARGALLMFDLTRFLTLKKINNWLKIVRKHDENLPVLLVGTKVDLEDRISIDDDYALEMKEQYDLFDFIKISSKTGENVEKCFEMIVEHISSK